jgi:acetate CoA/acetoacetate CoA-transferase alpha subunit
MSGFSNSFWRSELETENAMKTAITLETAVAMIPDGATLMIGGFLGVGSPQRLIQGLVSAGRKDLTVIANDSSFPGIAIGKLIASRMVKRLITSHIGTNPETQRQMIAGELEVELVPQGTLAERIRTAGFGLGGVLTRTGLGTLIEAGKRTVEIDGETWLLEKPLRADFALINAKQADYFGNLAYEFTAQNFNPAMATAAGTVIAEADEIVPVGAIPPDAVRTPGVLVDFLLESRP